MLILEENLSMNSKRTAIGNRLSGEYTPIVASSLFLPDTELFVHRACKIAPDGTRLEENVDISEKIAAPINAEPAPKHLEKVEIQSVGETAVAA